MVPNFAVLAAPPFAVPAAAPTPALDPPALDPPALDPPLPPSLLLLQAAENIDARTTTLRIGFRMSRGISRSRS
jgi:hypothetical protein